MPSPEIKDIDRLISRATKQLEQQLPFVVYRKPSEKEITGLFQNNPATSNPVDFEERGFLFAPFEGSEASILLQPDEQLTADFESTANSTSHLPQPVEMGKEEHVELVQLAVDRIASGDLDKVIVSRQINAKTDKNCFEIFIAALERYPNSFCYLWFHPATGIWMGASPEVFLSATDENIETVALAGTLKTENGIQPVWTTKEKDEQQMVTDFIYNCFAQQLDEITVSTPATIKAGSVWHLKSKISGKVRADFELGKLIQNLHPTPAVCGFPKQKAFGFIKENESYHRSFYTGFLGELNFGDNQTNLYVNLRCMKFDDAEVSIFAGGGITKNSIPELEWIETQHKSQTMLSLL